MKPDRALELALGPSLGLIAHLLLKRKEPSTPLEFALIPASIGLLESTIFSFSLFQILLSISAFLAVLSVSILYYRILSPRHPLHHIPGPVIARSTQLWLFWRLYSGYPRIDQRKLHEKYGPVVRIGPNEVSIADAASLSTMHGGKPWLKGNAYSFTASGGAATAETALASITDHKEHTFRRKIWDRAFAIASLKNYQPRIALRIQQLCAQFDRISREQKGGPVELQTWLNYLVFDVMTDLAWGGGGDATINSRDPDGAIASLTYGLHLAGMTKVLPWFGGYMIKLPWTQNKLRRFYSFAREMFDNRQRRGVEGNNKKNEGKDVFYHLLGEGTPEGRQISINALQADSRQVVTAGGDTTVSAMTALFYYLLSSPKHYKLLQAALDDLYAQQNFEGRLHEEFDALAKLPLLEACINEALRLQPPIPFQNQRVVPSTGATIQSIYLPGGTNARTALYAIARSPSNFTSPDEFRPQRWNASERSETEIFNPKASAPFLLGPYHCVGRNFALQEIRYTVATLVRRYDFWLVEGFDKVGFEGDMEDRSVMEIQGVLDVVVAKRA